MHECFFTHLIPKKKPLKQQNQHLKSRENVKFPQIHVLVKVDTGDNNDTHNHDFRCDKEKSKCYSSSKNDSKT